MLDISQSVTNMNPEAMAVIVSNFALIGALPFVFFKRDGKFNAGWWTTALPFYLSVGSLVVGDPALGLPFLAVRLLCATALSVSSIFLIAYTLGTHRIPIALWHQTNDQPQHIVTWGAYRLVRHPFYSSFLLAFAAATLAAPQVVTLGCLLFGAVKLNATAAKEEAKLSTSEFGEEYREYKSHTGRFVPRAQGVANLRNA